MGKTTCALDCYDGCSVIYEDGKLKGDFDHPFTQGVLCPSLNGFLKTKRVTKPTFNGNEITMDKALEILSTTLKQNQNKESLFFKGNANMGKMQNVSNLFFQKYGSTFTKGSLCDGAGDAGVISGRGLNLALPISQIKKSDVIVIWGRNISTTNSHMMDIIKDKTLIVIDPVKTKIAKLADVHLQLRPRSDFSLAILFTRFVSLEDMEDLEFIKKHCEEFDYFVDFFRSFGIKKLYDEIDVRVDDVMRTLFLMKGKKVSFLVGVGVQKYINGDEVLRAIDSFAAMLGLFGKEGCGVSYISDSSAGFANPFSHKNKTVPMPTVDFSKFKTVFIQGSNPCEQMPNSFKVCEELNKSEFTIYFGLYENETSKIANLVIPAKTFLEKDDIRFSYGSEYIGKMPKILENDFAISEYDLTHYLNAEFGYEALKSENEYLEEIFNSNSILKDGYYQSASYEKIPYEDGFYTDDEKFIFMDEIYSKNNLLNEKGYYLITPKSKHSINSQFKIDNYLYLSSTLGFKDSEFVKASSTYGESIFEVRVDENLREDLILIHSGAKGVNRLTPSLKSDEGDSAVFQEVKVKLERVV